MKMRWIKTGVTGAVLLAIMGIGIGSTLAYLTSNTSIANTFTVGDLDIGLKEPDWNPDDGDGKNVYPGYSVYKNPTIKNITSSKNGEEPCYARMRILLMDGSGSMITDPERLTLIKTMIRYDSTYSGNYSAKGTGQKIVQGKIPGYSLEDLQKLPMINPLFILDKTRSSENELVCNYMGKDGRGILKIGEQAALFTALAVPTQWTNSHMKKLGDFKIVVKAEAIQASGFAGQAEAFSALDNELRTKAGPQTDEEAQTPVQPRMQIQPQEKEAPGAVDAVEG